MTWCMLEGSNPTTMRIWRAKPRQPARTWRGEKGEGKRGRIEELSSYKRAPHISRSGLSCSAHQMNNSVVKKQIRAKVNGSTKFELSTQIHSTRFHGLGVV